MSKLPAEKKPAKSKEPKVKVSTSKRISLLVLAAAVLLAVAGGVGWYLVGQSKQATVQENKDQIVKVDKLIERGDCKKGLDSAGDPKVDRYNTEAKIATLDYLMQCNALEGKYDKAIDYANQLRETYKKEKNSVKVEVITEQIKIFENTREGKDGQ